MYLDTLRQIEIPDRNGNERRKMHTRIFHPERWGGRSEYFSKFSDTSRLPRNRQDVKPGPTRPDSLSNAIEVQCILEEMIARSVFPTLRTKKTKSSLKNTGECGS